MAAEKAVQLGAGEVRLDAEPGEGVRQEEVLAVFAHNIDRLKGILTEVLTGLPGTDACSCASWADGIDLPYEVPGP